MAMEPEARIAPPEGNGEPLENMSGGRDRVHGAHQLAVRMRIIIYAARHGTVQYYSLFQLSWPRFATGS